MRKIHQRVPFSAEDCICAIKVDNKRIRKTSLSGRRLFFVMQSENSRKEDKEMTLQETAEKSMDIRKIYHALEKEMHGKEWTSEEDALAFLTDAALTGRLVMAKEGRWPSSEESMLPSKIGECVWWLAVLAEENGLSFADCVETFLKEKEEFLKQE